MPAIRKYAELAVRKAAGSLGHSVSFGQAVVELDDYPFTDVLEALIGEKARSPDFFFVQIGAHDGVYSDPINHAIKRHRWRGLLIEPQAEAFDALLRTYAGHDQLAFENAAVADTDGSFTFYSVRRDLAELPEWIGQVASLDRNAVRNLVRYCKTIDKSGTIPDDFEKLISETSVPACKLATLIDKHGIERIDLLVIDTIGYDYELIKSLPFDRLKPTIIQFEHSLLSAFEQADCFKYLQRLGYGLTAVGVDTIACLDAPVRNGRYVVSKVLR